MALRNMLCDRVSLVKPDGRRFENVTASVQTDKIFTDDPNLPIEEGDMFERRLPSGLLEIYEVTDRGYMEGRGSIPSHYQSKVRKALPANPKKESTTTMLKLFVSHSSKDRAIVTLLVDLIRSAMNLGADEIRCTSVDGYRLPGGANTLDQLRREVHDAQAFIGVISAESLESMYVAFELGARWGAHNHLLPILAPGTDANILSGPLSGINALRCDSAAQLHQLISDLSKELAAKAESPSVLQRQIDAILQHSQETKKDASSKRAAIPEGIDEGARLSELEFAILVAVGKQRCETAREVASAVRVTEEKAKYYLDELDRKHRLLDWFGNMDHSIPERYRLTHAGRKLLVERGVFE